MVSSVSSGSLVGRFEHLSKRPRSDEARPLLEKIVSQVKPIMSKRSWNVGTLAEFLPSNPSLLGNNMNAGQRINLRLRPPGDTSNFYEYDQLVLVMLHELTHIEHGPHDASFYKLLAELEEEFYELKRKGYSGEGFHGTGNHLPGIKLNEYEGRAKGLQAAQKRLEVQRKIGKGGVLGGSGTAGKSMKEVLAEAAERRIRDDKACHPESDGHAREIEKEVRRAAEESVGVDAVDLEGEGNQGSHALGAQNGFGTIHPSRTASPRPTGIGVPPKDPVTRTANGKLFGVASGSETTPRTTGINPPKRTIDRSFRRHPADPALPDRNTALSSRAVSHSEPVGLPNGEWSCPTCTLLNPSVALACEACTAPRPGATLKAKVDVWYCEFCSAGPRGMEFWSCGECGWVRKWG